VSNDYSKWIDPETDDQIEGLLDALKKHIDGILASIAAAENETHEELQAR
jgi:hypothetical protein